MIEVIPGTPDNVLAITAKGEVTKEDYEKVVFPAMAEIVKDHDKIRFLYHMDPVDLKVTVGGLWEDDHVARKYYHRFEKWAVAADQNWAINSVKAFGWMLPGQKKIFGADELDDALAWVAD